MRVFENHRSVEGGPYAIAIGVFDAVHLGHRALLEAAKKLAEADGIASLALTFDPHPARVLAPHLAPKMLEPIERRIEHFESLGMDTALVQPFSKEFASQSPEDFVREVLVRDIGVRHVVVGEGFTFGHRQAGTVETLGTLGAETGFVVHPIPAVKVDGIHVSSTKVREFVARGKMRGAALLLGRPYSLRGTVIRGAGRGGKLGIPTANLEPAAELLPVSGVYAAQVRLGDLPNAARLQAVVNIGTNPTFGKSDLKIEAHILDFEPRELYGETVDIELMEKLRDEQRFDGPDALLEQIKQDIQEARGILSP